MVLFKQKEFSSPATKFIFKAKQSGNKVASVLKLAPQKSKTQIAKEAITLKNNLRPETIKGKTLEKVIETGRKVKDVVYQPGSVANKGIKLVAENPAAAVTYVATAALPVPSVVISGAVNKVAKKVPAYSKAVEKLGNAWRNSNISRKLEGISGYDISRRLSMFPLA